MEWRAGMIRRREDWLCRELARVVGVLQWGFEERGGGHRVKMREDPPSGARTLIDFYLLLSPPLVDEKTTSIHAHQTGWRRTRRRRRMLQQLFVYQTLSRSVFVSVARYFLLNGLTGSAAWRLTRPRVRILCFAADFYRSLPPRRPAGSHRSHRWKMRNFEFFLFFFFFLFSFFLSFFLSFTSSTQGRKSSRFLRHPRKNRVASGRPTKKEKRGVARAWSVWKG